jgi:hypothetical protein
MPEMNFQQQYEKSFNEWDALGPQYAEAKGQAYHLQEMRKVVLSRHILRAQRRRCGRSRNYGHAGSRSRLSLRCRKASKPLTARR